MSILVINNSDNKIGFFAISDGKISSTNHLENSIVNTWSYLIESKCNRIVSDIVFFSSCVTVLFESQRDCSKISICETKFISF